MTTSVYSFRDGVGRLFHVRLYRMAPAAYGNGGYPLLVLYTNLVGLYRYLLQITGFMVVQCKGPRN
jgi:hypothetical protein